MHLLPLLFALPIHASLLAFPSADGFGRFATGARAGENYVVSNLKDEGPGSLRDALSKPNRMVSFNVSGIIRIKKRMICPKRTTILGQTAPGEGITVYGNGWSFSGADGSVIRHIRIRMGKVGDSKKDCMTLANGHNMIFDHVSAYWGRDETFSINAGDKAGNITIQNSIIAQGLETHSAGGLMQCSGGISILRTLYADNKTRNPKVKGKNDFTNNVVYNWGGGGGYIAGGSEGESNVNIVGNYFISGPSTGSTKPFVRGNDQFKAYVKNNYADTNKDGTLNGKELPLESGAYGGVAIVAREYAYPRSLPVLAAPDALKTVLKEAGASKVRDAVDRQLVKQVESWGKEGKLIHGEDETAWAQSGKQKRDVEKRDVWGRDMVDSDGDGVPDWFEAKMGWDSTKNDGMVVEDTGYTRLETWANWLA